MKKVNEYLSIKQASEYLGVTINTLRNWEKSSKMKVSRNPLNHYRLYDKQHLEDFLKNIQST